MGKVTRFSILGALVGLPGIIIAEVAGKLVSRLFDALAGVSVNGWLIFAAVVMIVAAPIVGFWPWLSKLAFTERRVRRLALEETADVQRGLEILRAEIVTVGKIASLARDDAQTALGCIGEVRTQHDLARQDLFAEMKSLEDRLKADS